MTAAELAEIDDDIAAADRKYAETTTGAARQKRSANRSERLYGQLNRTALPF